MQDHYFQSEPRRGVLFESITRQHADIGLRECLMYFINYGFYKFGLEARRSTGDTSSMFQRVNCAADLLHQHGAHGGLPGRLRQLPLLLRHAGTAVPASARQDRARVAYVRGVPVRHAARAVPAQRWPATGFVRELVAFA